VKRGSALYAEGRYIEAAEVFERTEGRLAESSPREKADYALYRGMTYLVLGDFANSHRWLTYAYDIERAVPGSLHQDKRALLDRGWYDLGQKLHPAVAPPPTAVAASQPPPPIPPPEPLPRTEKRDSTAPLPSKHTLVPQ
jgi:tetratricopeptide (TPR) repeat protein